MNILWSPLALDRVAEIAEYIARDNPGAAEKWVYTIFQKVNEMKSFPESGRMVPETGNKSIREHYCPVNNQIISTGWIGRYVHKCSTPQ